MAEVNGETTHCSNCKKDIAMNNFVMHEMHCRRHIVLCDNCKEPVPRSELEKHFNELHAKVTCTVCGDPVEKDQLEHHMVRTCSRKPSQCSYCELQLPLSELQSHVDYCGTRTEPCPTCGQFVMLKDQLQHETSACQYPAPKPHDNTLSGASNEHTSLNHFQYHEAFHPFAFEEIGRILEHSRIAPPAFRRGAGGDTVEPSAPFETSRMLRPLDQTRNDTTARKSTTNRKSELNKKRERELPVTERHYDDEDDANVVADRLLALQLAQDLDSGDDLNQLIQNYEKQNSVPQPELPSSALHISPDLNSYPEDEVLMPCEFCDELISADNLIEHQSGCDPMSVAWMEPVLRSQGCNNESATPSQHTVTNIPVINNLGRHSQPPVREVPIFKEWDSPVYVDSDSEEVMLPCDSGNEEVMLPCEFCEALFPQDDLVQHQSVCEFNTSLTPRATTPAAPKTPKPRNVRNNFMDSDTSSESHKHQAIPDLSEYLGLTEEQESVFYTPSLNDTRPEILTPTSSKYGVPTDRFDDHLTRPPRLDHHQHHPVEHSVNHSERPQQRGSAARIRNTLESLLHEDETPGAIDYLASVKTSSSQKKAMKNEDNLEKRKNVNKGPRKVAVNTNNSSAHATQSRHRPTGQRSNQGSVHTRGIQSRPRQSNGSVVDEPSFQFRSAGQQRQRTGHQIFSPAARGNAQHRSPYPRGDKEN